MTTLQTLQAKILTATSATELNASLTDAERVELGNCHVLLQPMPHSWLPTAERRYFGINNLGQLIAVDCPPAAMGAVWGYRIATDTEILAGLISQEAQVHG